MQKNFFFPFQLGRRPYPEFLPDIGNQERVQSLLDKNNRLKEKQATDSKVEYFIHTPSDYHPRDTYPLVILTHGGWGSHTSLRTLWHSEKMQSEYEFMISTIDFRSFSKALK